MGVNSAAKALRARWRGARAACLVAGAWGVLGAGCEVARPLNSFEGGLIPVPAEAAQGDFGKQDEEDFGPPPGSGETTGGATGAPTGGMTTTVGSTGGQTTGQTPSSSGDSGAVTPDDPLLKLVGDYYFRLDEVNVADGGAGLGLVTSTTLTYGQIRVDLGQDGVLTGVERLCHTDTQQQSEARALRTYTDPAVAGRIASVRRTFRIEEGSWSTDEVRRRTGWKVGSQGDELPTDIDAHKDAIIDVDEDGYAGVRVHVEGKLLVQDRACAFDMVSFSDTAYVGGGFDAAGALGAAKLQYGKSDAYAFFGTPASECSTADINNGDKGRTTGELTMHRLEQPLADFGACAPESEFEAALR